MKKNLYLLICLVAFIFSTSSLVSASINTNGSGTTLHYNYLFGVPIEISALAATATTATHDEVRVQTVFREESTILENVTNTEYNEYYSVVSTNYYPFFTGLVYRSSASHYAKHGSSTWLHSSYCQYDGDGTYSGVCKDDL